MYTSIGQHIRELRADARQSQEDLAQRIGVSANTISRWETATYKVGIDDLARIADCFNVHISTFFSEDTMSTRQYELNAWDAMVEALRHLKATKSDARTPRDRYVAVTITELEKVMAHFNLLVMQERDFLAEREENELFAAGPVGEGGRETE